MATTPFLTRAALAAAAAVAATGLLPSSASAAPPPVTFTHVWQIQLENESSTATYAPCASAVATYLDCTLVPRGRYLADYYATGHVSLDNYLSEAAGVPGNPVTDSDCQLYENYNGTGATDAQGVPTGEGCVYPAGTLTLEDQLHAGNLSWQGLMGDMGFTATRETATCGQPATAGTPDDPSAVPPPQDDTQSATAADQYAARHNPFAYFHSLVDSRECAANVKPLGGTGTDALSGLDANLANPPNFTWITPNLCDDGHDTGCQGTELSQKLGVLPGTKGAGGLSSADRFLSIVVPRIQASDAYKQGGLIIVTTDEASTSDFSSCCVGSSPTSAQVLPAGGGGKTGALLLSPLLQPGTSTVAYNHYSLLRSLEDNFGIGTHLGGAANTYGFGPDALAATPPASAPEVPLPALEALPLAVAGFGAWKLLRRRARSHR